MLRAKYINKVTEVNKIYLENIIKEGDIVIDATMGNGYDTVYLAKKVGQNGKVYAFDVQEEALKSTSKKVAKEALENVELILDGHQNMDKYVHEDVSCIVFNLGYLPRAKHQIITKANTTIEAIQKGLDLLAPNGVMSIAIYSGHEGGMEEKNEVYKFTQSLDQNYFNVLCTKFINQINNPPELLLIEKKG
ncbi:class I SAM-dependent methyltransferase [Intestinibacter sp.]